MNYKMIIHMLGQVSLFEAMFMILPLAVSVIYREPDGFAYLATMAACAMAKCA